MNLTLSSTPDGSSAVLTKTDTMAGDGAQKETCFLYSRDKRGRGKKRRLDSIRSRSRTLF